MTTLNHQFGIPDWDEFDVGNLLGSTTLEKTIHGFLEIWGTSAGFRKLMLEWGIERLSTAKRRRDAAIAMIEGIKRQGMFHLIRGIETDLTAIRNAGKSAAGHVGCVYLVVCDFPAPDGIHYRRTVYGGLTRDFAERDRAHRKAHRATRYHKSARWTSSRKMFPVCRVNGDDKNSVQLRILMEQCAVSMWDLYIHGSARVVISV